jgi:hypothetical protein
LCSYLFTLEISSKALRIKNNYLFGDPKGPA